MKADQIVPPTDRGNARLTVLTWIAGAAVVFPVISECAFYFLPHSSEEGPDRALLAVEIVLWASSIVALTILVGCLVARIAFKRRVSASLVALAVLGALMPLFAYLIALALVLSRPFN